ncbi:type VI secretion system tip protein VgrG [Pseudenhygromyxa sp. WMMC2535]|uniref:type VI secretion system Vgr family protein n=1 Tax=Pseudenhygromyxa sp. WMMC2535 TaxID=2712867 RepID=UPI001595C12A|nr:type VI secretion system tip protein TssI/VgrG [Pseudenhygromyxa sp. WMMC2535]NVB39680.1 type VI secretion system tip protein VgrG [Pseudenhygromyxa sp. WMMC2535]
MNIANPLALATLEVEFRCEDTEPATLQVRRLSLSEQVDCDYQANLMLSSHEDFDPNALLGADCELVISRGVIERRRLFGVIEEVEDRGELDHQHWVELRVVPAFALLDMGQNTRIWQHRSVREIINTVLERSLGAYGRSFDFGMTTRGAAKRDYCVQYRESDRAFVRRLLEEEGLAYDYVHEPGAGVEQLTLRDANNQYPKLENLDGSEEVPLVENDAAHILLESIQAFGYARRLTVTGALRRDYDWREPNSWLDERSEGEDQRARQRRVYLHQHRRYIHDDLDNQVSDTSAAETFEGEALAARSNISALMPGMRFRLTDASAELEQEYLVTRVKHEYQDTEDGSTYGNEFTCGPSERLYRPRQRTPKPRVHGPHTATVVGDDEIHTDEHGRIQVQFHWEETPSHAADASCWIRCAQSWSGPGWGAQFIPRRGMEVMVEFIEGNPDRPLVTGCVYNGANEFPFEAPANKTQSGWRTRSSPNSDGYNMLRFEDATGHEEIHIHGQKDWSIVIENDKDQHIHHDETARVYHDRTKTVDHDERERIGNDRWIAVGSNHTETIGLNMSETVGVNKTVAVGVVMSTTVGEDMHTVVGDNMSEGVGDTKTATVGVDSHESVGAKKVLTVGKEYAIVCGKASIVLRSNGEIVIRGTKIDSETSGDTDIRGGMIKLNC